MPSPRVLVLRAPGTNCNEETAHAFALAGGACDQLHVNALLGAPHRLDDYQVFCLPGGFSYGDDIAAGRVLGNQLRLRLAESLASFRDAGKLVLGVCNGFQVLLSTGLLDLGARRGVTATLTRNDSGRFEARWVSLAAAPGRCVFLRGIQRLELPVAHAEGKFVCRGRLPNDQAVLRYAGADGREPGYPANPNGSADAVAGVCDATGRVFGLMPHPERFVDWTQHPRWTRLPAAELDRKPEGLWLFENAVRYFE